MTTNDSIPPAGWCLGCGYDLGGLAGEETESGAVRLPCPECGLNNGTIHDEQHRRRGALLAWGGTGLRWWVWGVVAVVLVYSIGASVFAKSMLVGVYTAMVLALAVLLSGGAGVMLTRLARPHERRMVAYLWLGQLWRLNLPWLVISVCAAVPLGVALAERAAGGGGGLVFLISVLGFIAWLAVCLGSWIVWTDRWTNQLGKHRIKLSAGCRVLYLFLSLGVCGCASLVGLGGGMLAVSGAMDLAGMDPLMFD